MSHATPRNKKKAYHEFMNDFFNFHVTTFWPAAPVSRRESILTTMHKKCELENKNSTLRPHPSFI